MDLPGMLRSFCDAVERRDGKAFAALFTEDGVYHDVFRRVEGVLKLAERRCIYDNLLVDNALCLPV